MRVELRSLDHVIDFVQILNKDQFAYQYPGYYLLAMGLLSAEQIAAGNPASALARQEEPLRTARLRFESSPRHVTGHPHPLAGQMFHFSEVGDEPLVVGRCESCQIWVPDESVSELHCQLQVGPAGLMVIDLGSTNGTSLNLRKMVPHQPELLSDGDMLTVGRYSFQLLRAETLYSTLALIRALEQ